MKRLNFATLEGSMRLIEKGGVDLAGDRLGISPEDLKLVTGSIPWIITDRQSVRRTLDMLIHGLVDSLGLPRFELPAEYVAAVISVFVCPCNYFAACSWIPGSVSNEDLVAGTRGEPLEGFEKVTPSQLFALLIEVAGEADKVAQRYSKKMGVKIERLAQVA